MTRYLFWIALAILLVTGFARLWINWPSFVDDEIHGVPFTTSVSVFVRDIARDLLKPDKISSGTSGHTIQRPPSQLGRLHPAGSHDSTVKPTGPRDSAKIAATKSPGHHIFSEGAPLNFSVAPLSTVQLDVGPPHLFDLRSQSVQTKGTAATRDSKSPGGVQLPFTQPKMAGSTQAPSPQEDSEGQSNATRNVPTSSDSVALGGKPGRALGQEQSSEETNRFARLGQWGDQYGGLNALFTGFALVFVCLTFGFQLLQEHQREKVNLEETRERRFFNHLDLLRTQTATIRIRDIPFTITDSSMVPTENEDSYRNVYFEDKAAFAEIERQTTHRLGIITNRKSEVEVAIVPEAVRIFELIYVRFRDHLSPYFRLLEITLKHLSTVDDTTFRSEAEALLRAALSDDEAFVIGLNCLTPRGRKLRNLVAKHHLLKFAHPKTLLRQEQGLPNKCFREWGDPWLSDPVLRWDLHDGMYRLDDNAE